MLVNVKVREQTRDLLAESVLEAPDADSKIRWLLQDEYLREMARYRRMDQKLSAKYKMDFDEFFNQGVVEKLEEPSTAHEDLVGDLGHEICTLYINTIK